MVSYFFFLGGGEEDVGINVSFLFLNTCKVFICNDNEIKLEKQIWHAV